MTFYRKMKIRPLILQRNWRLEIHRSIFNWLSQDIEQGKSMKVSYIFEVQCTKEFYTTTFCFSVWQYKKEIHQQWYRCMKTIYFSKKCPFQIFFCKWSSYMCCCYEMWVGIVLHEGNSCITLVVKITDFFKSCTYVFDSGNKIPLLLTSYIVSQAT